LIDEFDEFLVTNSNSSNFKQVIKASQDFVPNFVTQYVMVREVIDEVRKFFYMEKDTKLMNVEVSDEIPLIMYTDEERLKQVIINLASFLFYVKTKYTPVDAFLGEFPEVDIKISEKLNLDPKKSSSITSQKN
jgi:hypothetical protein